MLVFCLYSGPKSRYPISTHYVNHWLTPYHIDTARININNTKHRYINTRVNLKDHSGKSLPSRNLEAEALPSGIKATKPETCSTTLLLHARRKFAKTLRS